MRRPRSKPLYCLSRLEACPESHLSITTPTATETIFLGLTHVEGGSYTPIVATVVLSPKLYPAFPTRSGNSHLTAKHRNRRIGLHLLRLRRNNASRTKVAFHQDFRLHTDTLRADVVCFRKPSTSLELSSRSCLEKVMMPPASAAEFSHSSTLAWTLYKQLQA